MKNVVRSSWFVIREEKNRFSLSNHEERVTNHVLHESRTTRNEPRFWGAMKFSLLVGILSGIFGATLLWGVQTITQKPPLTVATLNVRALMDEEIAQVAKSKLTPKEAAEQVKQYAAMLSQKIDALSKAKHFVILPEQAVIAGGVDLTDEFRRSGLGFREETGRDRHD